MRSPRTPTGFIRKPRLPTPGTSCDQTTKAGGEVDSNLNEKFQPATYRLALGFRAPGSGAPPAPATLPSPPPSWLCRWGVGGAAGTAFYNQEAGGGLGSAPRPRTGPSWSSTAVSGFLISDSVSLSLSPSPSLSLSLSIPFLHKKENKPPSQSPCTPLPFWSFRIAGRG